MASGPIGADKGPAEVLRALASGDKEALAEALEFQRESFRAKFGCYPEELTPMEARTMIFTVESHSFNSRSKTIHKIEAEKMRLTEGNNNIALTFWSAGLLVATFYEWDYAVAEGVIVESNEIPFPKDKHVTTDGETSSDE